MNNAEPPRSDGLGARQFEGTEPKHVEPLSAPPAQATSKNAFKDVESLGFVMDVPVEVRVELGRRRTRIGELLKLGPGSILELDKPSGEPLDIFVNDRLIARGEAVVIGERYGIRLTEVLIHHDGVGSRDESA